jgi:hypothetical protein
VAYSKHIQSGRITYSHAIARAYEIESKLSIYPRIVIDENIIRMYETGSTLPIIFGKGHFLRQNGVVFLNVIKDDNWNEYYSLASDLFLKQQNMLEKNESGFLKHLWFEKYLFESAFADFAKPKYIESIMIF